MATGRLAHAPLDCVGTSNGSPCETSRAGTSTRSKTLNGSADRVVDKMPENTLYLGLIAALFPRATLIHCRRDPRDVALSCWMTHFAEIRWACDPDHIASRIVENQRVMDHWQRVLPVPIFELDYEAMVADLERRVAAARGLVRPGLGPGLPRLPQDPAARCGRPASQQVRQPIYTSSVGRWKNYQRPLAWLFAKLGNIHEHEKGSRADSD